MIMENTLGAITESSKIVRYALGSNARTARLTVLMLIVVISWHLLM
jgi:hypothetical protein